jgi:hypothetical protein
MSELAMEKKSLVGRIAGGMIAETGGEYFLIGELKEPYDFSRIGFQEPQVSEETRRIPYQKLQATGPVSLEVEEYLQMETQGEALAKLLHKRFVIPRNNSVSNRLWNAVTGKKDAQGRVDARWLEQMPDEIWDIVRDSLLRCL